mgnify:CR=1 FL=1
MLKTRKQQTEVFDPVRKKWVAFTPEEQVRQCFLQYLIQERHIPVSHIAVEKEVPLNGVAQRFDLMVFDAAGTPLLVVECKAPSVTLTQSVLEQVGRYNQVLRARAVGVTNGRAHYFFKTDFDTGKITFLQDFPLI